MGLDYVVLRFDGSLRGSCCGAGAVLVHHESVIWQGAKFVPRCATSVAAEYEGLLFGLQAARRLKLGQLLAVEGDCNVVIRQMLGSARARKLHQLNSKANEATYTFSPPPAFRHIDRQLNMHADALSRAAIDSMQMLHCAAVRSTIRRGCRSQALRLLCGMKEQNVPCPTSIFEELISASAMASDWDSVLHAFAEAQGSDAIHSDSVVAAAIRACEARDGRQDHKLRSVLARRQVAARRAVAARQRRAAHAQRERDARSMAMRPRMGREPTPSLTADDAHPFAVSPEEDRRVSAHTDGEFSVRPQWPGLDFGTSSGCAGAAWWQMLVDKAGGPDAIHGRNAEPAVLLELSRMLMSEHGLAIEGQGLSETPR